MVDDGLDGLPADGYAKGMKKIPCPQCRAPADAGADNAYRPFCSERCQQLDLAAWLDGDYRIPAEPVAPDAHDPDLGDEA